MSARSSAAYQALVLTWMIGLPLSKMACSGMLSNGRVRPEVVAPAADCVT
jgi:hypothetical protein